MFNVLMQEPYIQIWMALVVLVAGVVIIKCVNDIICGFLKKKDIKKLLEEFNIDENITDLFVSGIKYLLYVIVVVLAIGQFGVTTIFLEVIIYLILVAIFVMVILSLKDFVINASAGIYLVKNKHIQKNDRIRVNGYEGKVDKITLVSVFIKEDDGKIVMIPNSKLNGKIITKLK